MKLSTMTALIALAATPAFAVGAQTEIFSNTGPGSKAVVDGSPGTSIVSPSSISRGGRGGAGGSGGSATTGASTANANGSVVINQSGGGGGGHGRAPDVVVGSPSAGGFDCPVVGIGGGGSGLGGGGTGIASWISTSCNARKLAELANAMGRPDVAWQLLQDNDYQFRHAVEKADAVRRQQPQPVAFVPSAWCAKATAMERKHNPQSCGVQ